MKLLAPKWIVSVRQYCLPGGHAEITNMVKELCRVGIICSTQSPFNSPVLPVHKPDGSWRMTVDYWKFSKVVLPIHAAVPNITQLLNEVSESLGTYYFVLDITLLLP